MNFEYDQDKSKSNELKHGLDFEKGQALWVDPDFVTIEAKTEDEKRILGIGKINDKHWSAIFTFRGNKIRIISIRRSRSEEVDIYESERI